MQQPFMISQGRFLRSVSLSYGISIPQAAFPKRFVERFVGNKFRGKRKLGVLTGIFACQNPQFIGSLSSLEVAHLLGQFDGSIEVCTGRFRLALFLCPNGVFQGGPQRVGQALLNRSKQCTCIVHGFEDLILD
jgi:hypothetical protein